jgi:hypothetical protein
MSNQSTKYNTAILIAGALFIIWGLLGLQDSKNYTYAGYNSDDNWTVNKVEEGSPAETAGLQIGDIVKSTGGIAVTDSKALNKRERPEIGETREIVVDRNGEEETLNLTYAALTEKDQTLNMVGFFIGILFIVLGVYSNQKHKTTLSNAFAVFSICFGFLFMSGPHISSDILNNIVGFLSTAVVLFSFTSLAVYMLRYTPESAFLSSKNNKLLYIPMFILLGIIAFLQIFQPEGSGTLNMVMRLLFGAFIIGYFLLAVITLFKKYLKATPADRSSNGLNMMLLGTILGLIPILIYITIGTLSPGTELPGNDYVFFTFAAIPICFTIALNQLSSSSAKT